MARPSISASAASMSTDRGRHDDSLACCRRRAMPNDPGRRLSYRTASGLGHAKAVRATTCQVTARSIARDLEDPRCGLSGIRPALIARYRSDDFGMCQNRSLDIKEAISHGGAVVSIVIPEDAGSRTTFTVRPSLIDGRQGLSRTKKVHHCWFRLAKAPLSTELRAEGDGIRR